MCHIIHWYTNPLIDLNTTYVLFVGIGEQIIIKGGARTFTDYALNPSIDFSSHEFLENFYQCCGDEPKAEFGFLHISVSSGLIELFASHSTPSFIFGWMASGQSKHMEISRLKEEKFKSFATCLQIKR